MKTIFTSKKSRKFNAIMKMANELAQKLSWVPDCINGMDRIVEFFQSTSPVQDEFLKIINGGLRFKNEKKQKFVDDFAKFLGNSGRNIYGWNRTRTGEIPLYSSVYVNMLVPYDELFCTRSIAEHLSRKKNPVGEVDYALKEESRGKYNETEFIEKTFVNPFMQGNYKLLKDALEKFSGN